MMIVYLLQSIVPLVLIAWLAFAPPGSTFGFWIQAIATTIGLVAISYTGIWTFTPWCHSSHSRAPVTCPIAASPPASNSAANRRCSIVLGDPPRRNTSEESRSSTPVRRAWTMDDRVAPADRSCAVRMRPCWPTVMLRTISVSIRLIQRMHYDSHRQEELPLSFRVAKRAPRSADDDPKSSGSGSGSPNARPGARTTTQKQRGPASEPAGARIVERLVGPRVRELAGAHAA